MKKRINRMATEPSLTRKTCILGPHEIKNFNSQKALCVIKFQLDDDEHKVSIYQHSKIQAVGESFLNGLQFAQDLSQQNRQQFAAEVNFKILEKLLHVVQDKDSETSLKKKEKILGIARQYAETSECKKFIKKIRKDSIVNYFITNSLTNQLLPFIDPNQRKVKSKSQYKFRLYEKGQQSLQKRNEESLLKAKEKLRQEWQQCTFQPDTTLSSNNTARRQVSTDRSKINIFDKLYQHAGEIRAKKSFRKVQLKQENEKSFRKQCSFEPKLNQCSQEIVELKNQIKSQTQNLPKEFVSSIQTEFNLSTDHQPSKKVQKGSNAQINRVKAHNQQKRKQKDIMAILSGFKKIKADTPSPKKVPKGQKPFFDKVIPNQRQQSKRGVKKQNDKQNIYLGIKVSKTKKKNLHNKTMTFDERPRDQFLSAKPLDLSFSNLQGIGELSKRVNTEFIQHDEEELDRNEFLNTKHINFSKINDNSSGVLRENSSFKRNQNNVSEEKLRTQNPKPNYFCGPQYLQNFIEKQKHQIVCQELFKCLSQKSEQNQIHQVSSHSMKCCKKISNDVKDLLGPLCQEIQEMETTLDEEEFTWSMENLFQYSLSEQQKTYLFEWCQKSRDAKHLGVKLESTNGTNMSEFFSQRNIEAHQFQMGEGSVFQVIG